MRYPSITFFNKLKFARIPSEQFPHYAYALICCQFPTSVVSGDWYHSVDNICSQKVAELREEINRRIENGDKANVLTHALEVIAGMAGLFADDKMPIISVLLTQLSVAELIELYAINRYWHDMRRRKSMEVYTRSLQWRIVNELLHRKDAGLLAQILQLAEFIEADNYADMIGMHYNVGDVVKTFTPSDYASDKDLECHISSLSRKADYVSREELIQIADYIQTEIVESCETVNHMPLVNAILCTNMPSFNYPKIVKGFEDVVKSLAKTKEKPDIELAPYFYSLWGLTQKPTYLSRFEKTLRHCYLTLASNKSYPDLGINKDDADSLATALQFLDEHRMNVWIINDKYDVDKVIRRYKTA